MSEAPCPFCTKLAATVWCNTCSEDGTAYQAKSCVNCGTTFLSPPPSEDQLNRAYATSYYGSGETKFNGNIERIRQACSAFRTKKLADGLSVNADILDIGCGDGRLLRNFYRAGFRNLHGVELPGPAAERAAKTRGINLHLGTLASTNLPAASYDLITLVHVFEHLPAPRDTLDQLVRLVRPGGRIFLSFPNISSWQARLTVGNWFHLDPPRHLTLVPPQTVIGHLANKGCKLISEHHFCLEQNIYGWIQSVLNCGDHRRNFLYERLKRNHSYAANRGVGSLVLHAGIGGLLFFPALLADCCSAAVGAGATVELMFASKPELVSR